MTDIQQGLLITAIGMGLVFVVIIFLWGLMALLVRLTSKKTKNPPQTPDATDQPLVPQMAVAEARRRAVAAGTAVALALHMGANQNQSTLSSRQRQPEGLSPWQAAHRFRQLQTKDKRG